MIQYLKHKDIDFIKWDKTIDSSLNGIIYAYSWYLDIVSSQWDALIFDDYKYIMPLTFKKKWGLSYLYQPPFAQQLGIFASKTINPQLVSDFIRSIPKHFIHININLNVSNKFSENIKYHTIQRLTYQLNLNDNYETIYNRYSINTKRNIKKSYKNKIFVQEGMIARDFVNFICQNVGLKYLQKHREILLQLVLKTIHTGRAKIYCAYTAQNNLCGAVLFISSHNKIIYLISGLTQEGKKQGAMFRLIDNFIKKYSARDYILDFEGSQISSIARFFQGFGAKAVYFSKIKNFSLKF